MNMAMRILTITTTLMTMITIIIMGMITITIITPPITRMRKTPA